VICTREAGVTQVVNSVACAGTPEHLKVVILDSLKDTQEVLRVLGL
jgi:hypothetical protein